MSLISLLRKGRYVYIDLNLPPIHEQILDPRTVKVNVNAVMSDIVETHDTSTDEFVDFGRIPPAIPPFPTMWLEGRYENSQSSYGYLVDRRAGSEVHVVVCLEHEAQCGLNLFWFLLHLDADGRLDGVTHSFPEADETDGHRLLLIVGVLTVALSLARMNCRNVTLRQMASGRKDKRIEKQNPGPPATVWHEIVINSVPKTRRTANAEGAHGEGGVIRLHRVRGHFEDYSQGKGLFGKIKGVFWIPDYERGDRSAGEVISAYRIEAARTLRSNSLDGRIKL